MARKSIKKTEEKKVSEPVTTKVDAGVNTLNEPVVAPIEKLNSIKANVQKQKIYDVDNSDDAMVLSKYKNMLKLGNCKFRVPDGRMY